MLLSPAGQVLIADTRAQIVPHSECNEDDFHPVCQRGHSFRGGESRFHSAGTFVHGMLVRTMAQMPGWACRRNNGNASITCSTRCCTFGCFEYTESGRPSACGRTSFRHGRCGCTESLEKNVYAERDFPCVIRCMQCAVPLPPGLTVVLLVGRRAILLEIRRLCTGVAYGEDRLALQALEPVTYSLDSFVEAQEEQADAVVVDLAKFNKRTLASVNVRAAIRSQLWRTSCLQ